MTYEEARESLKTLLNENRYYHSVGVSNTASILAAYYNEDVEAAKMAGILHDCAKSFKIEENIQLCNTNKIFVSEAEMNNPQLLHAKLGAFLAEQRYGINDKKILSAIECHTTGKKNMSLFEKIIFIADYIEPGRNKAKRLNLIRKEAFCDIDNCLVMILEDTLEYLNKLGIKPDSTTKQTYEYYIGEINDRHKKNR